MVVLTAGENNCSFHTHYQWLRVILLKHLQTMLITTISGHHSALKLLGWWGRDMENRNRSSTRTWNEFHIAWFVKQHVFGLLPCIKFGIKSTHYSRSQGWGWLERIYERIWTPNHMLSSPWFIKPDPQPHFFWRILNNSVQKISLDTYSAFLFFFFDISEPQSSSIQ